MSAKINDVDVHVKCPNGHDNIIPIRDWIYDEECSEKSDEQMGTEFCHRFQIGGVQCSHADCGANVEGEIEIWEYPVGCEEYRGVSPNIDIEDANSAVEIVAD